MIANHPFLKRSILTLKWATLIILAAPSALLLIALPVMFMVGLVWKSGRLPSDKGPIFHRPDGLRSLNCYGGPPVDTPISVEFQDNGRTAILRSGQTEARLPFTSSGVFSDVYSDGTIEFWLDPEIYVSGLGDTTIGPCELD